MNGGCMNTKLIVITNTDWLIGWWFLCATISCIFRTRKSSTIYKIYTEMSEGPTTWATICDCHWKRMVSKVWTQNKTFYCHYNALSPFAKSMKRCSTCTKNNTLKIRSSLWFVVGRMYYSMPPTDPPYLQDNNMGTQCAALWVQLWKPSQIPSNQ